MKLKRVVLGLAVIGLMAGMTSCKDTTEEENNETKAAVIDQYLNGTVAPTFTALANKTQELVEALQTLQNSRTNANVSAACDVFLDAREQWEKSEAFLFGAASDFGIDPHIDSWPLDEDGFNTMMSNTQQMQALAGEEGDVYAGEYLGNALLGFHGIEYILFSNGQPKDASEISDLHMTYAVAVAGDLRNRCFQLEVSWLGDDAAPSHVARVEELELNCTVNGSDNSYGDNMRKAGEAGSTYSTKTQALLAIVDGCRTIADEVGTSKIGKPHNGEDPTYIESPYSQKSILDFYNNIISIQNAYMGGISTSRDEAKSLQNYVKTLDADLDARVIAAINNALTAIQNMKAPFVNNFTDASAGVASEACQAVDEILAEVATKLRTK